MRPTLRQFRTGVRKHRNQPMICPLRHRHKSKAEVKRCGELWALLGAGVIKYFVYEPHVVLADVSYKPDFFVVYKDRTEAFEEIKSPHTDKAGGRWAVIQTLWRKHAQHPLRVIHCKRGVLREDRTICPDPK